MPVGGSKLLSFLEWTVSRPVRVRLPDKGDRGEVTSRSIDRSGDFACADGVGDGAALRTIGVGRDARCRDLDLLRLGSILLGL
jgi:hypothetical protein